MAGAPLYAKPLAAGLLSAFLFMAVIWLRLGLLFLFIPSIPLLMCGLRVGARAHLQAAGTAALPVLLFTGVEGVIFYLGFLALPTLLIAPRALLYQDSAAGRVWFPVGLLLLDLVCYASLIFFAALALYAGQDGSLRVALSTEIGLAFAQIDPELQAMMESIATQFPHVLIAASVWWWVLLHYVHAWFSHRLLLRKQEVTRPNLAITAFEPPKWCLSLLAFSALIGMLGGGEMAFAAKTLMLIFLLPYFLLGISVLHLKTLGWQSRWLVLSVIYMMIAVLLWPAIVLACVGVWRHATLLLSRK